MISPEYWRKVYKPAYAKIVDAIKARGWYAHLHSDGVTDAIIEDLIEIGFDELNPQMSCMDIEDRRSPLRRQDLLPRGHGPPVHAALRLARRRGGVRASACSTPSAANDGGYIGYGQVGTDVPLANAEAMLAAFAGIRFPAGGATASI